MEGIEKICTSCIYPTPCNKRVIIIKQEEKCTTYKCFNYIRDESKKIINVFDYDIKSDVY